MKYEFYEKDLKMLSKEDAKSFLTSSNFIYLSVKFLGSVVLAIFCINYVKSEFLKLDLPLSYLNYPILGFSLLFISLKSLVKFNKQLYFSFIYVPSSSKHSRIFFLNHLSKAVSVSFSSLIRVFNNVVFCVLYRYYKDSDSYLYRFSTFPLILILSSLPFLLGSKLITFNLYLILFILLYLFSYLFISLIFSSLFNSYTFNRDSSFKVTSLEDTLGLLNEYIREFKSESEFDSSLIVKASVILFFIFTFKLIILFFIFLKGLGFNVIFNLATYLIIIIQKIYRSFLFYLQALFLIIIEFALTITGYYSLKNAVFKGFTAIIEHSNFILFSKDNLSIISYLVLFSLTCVISSQVFRYLKFKLNLKIYLINKGEV